MIWARVISRSCFCCMCTVSPILLFSTNSLHWSLRKSFLSLLAILWNCAFKLVYLSSSPLPLASPLFSAICKASCYFFAFLFLGDGFESSSKTSISAILTMQKHLTVWITIIGGKFWKRWEYQTTWPASWGICMQVRKQVRTGHERLVPNRKRSVLRLYIVTLLI